MFTFGLKTLYLGIFGLEFELFNQCPRIYFTTKSGSKLEILEFGTENALFWFFWTSFFVIFGVSAINFF